MSLVEDAAHDVRVGRRPTPDEEEGRDHTEPGQLVEDRGSVVRVGAVVERERHDVAGPVEMVPHMGTAVGDLRNPASKHPHCAAHDTRHWPMHSHRVP